MAKLVGSGGSNRIDLTGVYHRKGSVWILDSANGTTNLADTVSGLGGDDFLSGGKGNDSLLGGSGNDKLAGGDGTDTLSGGSGRDSLDGGTGNDFLTGGGGADILNGGDGNDVLNGGSGADAIVGGKGQDRFVYTSVADSAATGGAFDAAKGDMISGFATAAAAGAAHDRIDLSTLEGRIGHKLAFSTGGASAFALWTESGAKATTLFADTTGDGVADLAIRFKGAVTLGVSDFVGGIARPAAPVITAVSSTAPGLGNDLTPTLSGTAAAGATVTVFSGGVAIASTVADSSGNWSTTPASGIGGDGNYSFTAVVTGTSGHVSPASTPVLFTLDTTAPSAGALSLTGFSDTGSSNSDNLTSDNAFSLAVSGSESGATVTLQVSTDGGVTFSTTTASQSGLADGTYLFRAVVTDLAGNTATTAIQTVHVDTAVLPASLSFTGLSDTGVSGSDRVTSDNDFTLQITGGEAGSDVLLEVSGDGVNFYETTANLSGLPDGTYFYRATITDMAGNTVTTAIQTVVVDTEAFPGLVDFSSLTDTGRWADDGVTTDNDFFLTAVSMESDAVSSEFQVSTDNGISWSTSAVHQDTLADGTYFYRILLTDTAGNTAVSQISRVTIDNIAPGKASADLDSASDLGLSDTDNITTDTTPDITFFAETGSTVQVFMNGVALGFAVETGVPGRFAFAPGVLAQGTYTFTAAATDLAGNTGVLSDPLKITILADIDVASMPLSRGFRIFGADPSDYAGISVASAGDFNGDGFDDLIIGANGGDGSGNNRPNAGEAIVVFGSSAGFGDIEAGAADFVSSGKGFRIFAPDSYDGGGHAVASAGDINGDGFSDLIIGALGHGVSNTKSYAGEATVVFGSNTGFGNIDVAAADFVTSGKGFRIFGADAFDQNGFSVASAGDVNGDGFDDMIMGAVVSDGIANSKADAGEAIVVFGHSGSFGDIDLAAADFVSSGKGFRIFGADAGDSAGSSVASAGDINGDGIDDLIIGANWGDGRTNTKARSGEAIVVFGHSGGFGDIDLSADDFVSSGKGFRIFGSDSYDGTGVSAASAGDLNGDGFDDLIIGADGGDGSSNTKNEAGEAIVVFGHSTGFNNIDVAAADFVSSGKGFRIFGADANDRLAFSVASAGDVNGDGFADLIIGARSADGSGNAVTDAGEAVVIFGSRTGFGDIDMAAPDFMSFGKGFRIIGADDGDGAGGSVASAGDINGDGFDDLIVGASGGDGINNTKSFEGEAIVVFGSDVLGSVVYAGTESADVLTGALAAESFVAGLGNDMITGGGGADVMRGGQGSDTLIVGDAAFADIDGGSGIDSLKVGTNGLSFDFTSIADSRTTSIEVIDLTGNGANDITINARDILNMSDDRRSGFTFLTVQGDIGDTLGSLDTGWQLISSGTFKLYGLGQARLLVDADVLASF